MTVVRGWTLRQRALAVQACGLTGLSWSEVPATAVALPHAATALGSPERVLHWALTGLVLAAGLTAVLRPARSASPRAVLVAAAAGLAACSGAATLAGDAAALVAAQCVKGVCVGLVVDAVPRARNAGLHGTTDRAQARGLAILCAAAGPSCGLLLAGVVIGGGWRLAFAVPGAIAAALVPVGCLAAGRPAAAAPPVAPERDGPVERTSAAALRALTGVAVQGTYWGFLLVTSFHLQQQAGWSSWRAAGAMVVPASLLLTMVSPFTARLSGTRAGRAAVAVAAAGPPAGLLLYLGAPPDADYVTGILPTITLLGTGMAFAGREGDSTLRFGVASAGGGIVTAAVGTVLGASATGPAVGWADHRTAVTVLVGVAVAGLAGSVTCALVPTRRAGPDRDRPAPRPEPAGHARSVTPGR